MSASINLRGTAATVKAKMEKYSMLFDERDLIILDEVIQDYGSEQQLVVQVTDEDILYSLTTTNIAGAEHFIEVISQMAGVQVWKGSDSNESATVINITHTKEETMSEENKAAEPTVDETVAAAEAVKEEAKAKQEPAKETKPVEESTMWEKAKSAAPYVVGAVAFGGACYLAWKKFKS